jgi:hypothetical protein
MAALLFPALVGLIAIIATGAARRRPGPLTIGLAGGAWGFLIGFAAATPVAYRMAGVRPSADILASPALLLLEALGGTVGLIAGAWLALLVWAGVRSSREVRGGALCGLAAALLVGWPAMLLVPEQTFEDLELTAFLPVLTYVLLLGASLGAGFGDSVSRQTTAAGRRVLLIEAAVMVAAGGFFALSCADTVRAHTQSTRQLEARGDVRGLNVKLRSRDVEIRRRAARAYARADPVAAVHHADHRVRYHAALILADWSHPEAVPALIRVMGEIVEQNGSGFAAVAAALGKTRDERAVTALVAALMSESSEMRSAAAGALQEIDTPEARLVVRRLGLPAR